MEEVQVQHRPGPFIGSVHLNVVPVPDTEPGALVAAEELGEVGSPRHCQAGVVAALGNRAVPRGIERDDLLDRRRLFLLQPEGEIVGNKSGLFDKPAIHFGSLPVAQHSGACGECDSYARLVCLDLQIDRFPVDFTLAYDRQVLAVQVAVAPDACVHYRAIQPRADLDTV